MINDLQHWLSLTARPVQDAAPLTILVDDNTKWMGAALVVSPEQFCQMRAASFIFLKNDAYPPDGLPCKLDEWQQHDDEIWCYLLAMINWTKVNQAFNKANEAFKSLDKTVAAKIDKVNDGEMWRFEFSKLSWKIRLKTGWILMKASFSVILLGNGEVTFKKKKL